MDSSSSKEGERGGRERMAREGKESALYLGQEGGRNEDEFSLSLLGNSGHTKRNPIAARTVATQTIVERNSPIFD